jgi:hypothetical protein
MPPRKHVFTENATNTVFQTLYSRPLRKQRTRIHEATENQALVLLRLVLDILRLHGCAQLVLLSGVLIHGYSIGLFGLFSGQVLGKICLAHFQNVDDAATGASCQRSLDTLNKVQTLLSLGGLVPQTPRNSRPPASQFIHDFLVYKSTSQGGRRPTIFEGLGGGGPQ